MTTPTPDPNFKMCPRCRALFAGATSVSGECTCTPTPPTPQAEGPYIATPYERDGKTYYTIHGPRVYQTALHLSDWFVQQIIVSSLNAAHAHALSTQQARIDTLTKERDEAVKQLTAGPDKVLRCAFCGHEYPAGTPTHKSQMLADHIRVCPSHPIGQEVRTLTAQLAAAREALESIAEYWNGNANERAMLDACEHNVRTARTALGAKP